MFYLDAMQLIVALVSAACIGAFVALRREIERSREDVQTQSSKMDELNRGISKEHNAMAERIILVENRIADVQNYINSTTFNQAKR